MDWTVLLILIQLSLAVVVLAWTGALVLRALDSIEEHRAKLRAKHADDVKYIHVGPGHYHVWRGLLNGVEFKDVLYQSQGAPLPVVEEQRVPVRVNGELVKVLREPDYEHAVEILMQTRRHPDYGEGDQIIPANKFAGSNETWQKGKNYLDRHFGTITRPSIGTFCGPNHASISQLLRAVTADIPLPQASGNGGEARTDVK